MTSSRSQDLTSSDPLSDKNDGKPSPLLLYKNNIQFLELTTRVHATGQMQSKVQGLNYSFKFGLQIRVKYRQEIQGWPGAKCVSPILAGGTSSVRQTGDVTASHLSLP